MVLLPLIEWVTFGRLKDSFRGLMSEDIEPDASVGVGSSRDEIYFDELPG